MTLFTKYFMHSQDPGGTKETGNDDSSESNNESTESRPTTHEEHEHKPLGEKIKEALQDWSNKDQADQDFDDTRV
jgi:hypothetical protein